MAKSRNRSNQNTQTPATAVVTDVVEDSVSVDTELDDTSVVTETVAVMEDESPVATSSADTVVEAEATDVATEVVTPAGLTPAEPDTLIYSSDVGVNNNVTNALTTLTSSVLQSPAAIAKAQVQFYNSLVRGIIAADYKRFLTAVLSTIAGAPDSFTARKAFREFNALPSMDSTKLTEYETILRILIDTADGSQRKANVAAMRWSVIGDAISGKKYSDALLENLKDYYNV